MKIERFSVQSAVDGSGVQVTTIVNGTLEEALKLMTRLVKSVDTAEESAPSAGETANGHTEAEPSATSTIAVEVKPKRALKTEPKAKTAADDENPAWSMTAVEETKAKKPGKSAPVVEDEESAEPISAPALVKAKSRLKLTEDLVSAPKLRDVLAKMMEQGVDSVDDLVRECSALRENIPVLERIGSGLADRVRSAAEILGAN